MKKTYTIDLSEYGTEERAHAICYATEEGKEWQCDLEVDLDDFGFSKPEIKAIHMALREQFEQDIRRDYQALYFYWKGDRRSPLLKFQKGDRVSFKGGAGEILYVVPDNFGVKTTDGRVLNFSFKSLGHFLFKKV